VRDEYEPQKRAIAVYCEGITWLNIALDMLTGKQKELHGIPVPALQNLQAWVDEFSYCFKNGRERSQRKDHHFL
jgi:hypothetical protein